METCFGLTVVNTSFAMAMENHADVAVAGSTDAD